MRELPASMVDEGEESMRALNLAALIGAALALAACGGACDRRDAARGSGPGQGRPVKG